MCNSSGCKAIHLPSFQGVYISLNGTIVANNGNILIRDIGEDSNALLCFTDLTSCCDSSRKGEWVFPNGTNVSIAKFGSNFYRNRGQGVVRLNRRNGSLSPTGQYCCKVPDVTSSEKTVCVNISKIAYDYDNDEPFLCTDNLN